MVSPATTVGHVAFQVCLMLLVYFVHALAYRFYLNLLAAFEQTLVDLCTYSPLFVAQ